MGFLGRIRQLWRRELERSNLARPLEQAFDFAAPPSAGFAVFDVETTGLVARRDRVVEIAVVRTDPFGRIVDDWTTLLNPEGPVGATHIHGITAADVRRAPTFIDIAGELSLRLAGRALVAHNARFDLSFLSMEYHRAGWTMPNLPYLCTLDASSVYLSELARRRLSDCCWAAGIDVDGAHSALGDARATAGLLSYYLHPARPPRNEHMRLPASAVNIQWPPMPHHAVTLATRKTNHVAATPAAPGQLAALLDDLPLSSAMEEGAPPQASAYLELLAEALEDGILTAKEAESLTEVARIYALTRQQINDAHRGFLLALAHKAIEDGKVTRAEREDLLAVATALSFSDGIVKAVLDEARDALVEQRSESCKPLPPTWSHGEDVPGLVELR